MLFQYITYNELIIKSRNKELAPNQVYSTERGTYRILPNGTIKLYVDPTILTYTSAKQDTLISGTSIKTINGSSILGSGNLVISAASDLEQTLTTGNITNGNTIILSTDLDVIKSPSATGTSIILDDTYMAITSDNGNYNTPYFVLGPTGISLASLGSSQIDLDTTSISINHGSLIQFYVGAVRFNALTANTVLYLNGSKDLTSSSVTPTELGHLSGVTSAIQTQLGDKAPTASPTFTGTVVLPAGQVINNVTLTALGSATKYLNEAGAYVSIAGGGDVVGPASSTNNNVVLFDGLTGKLLKDSGLSLSGSNTGDETGAGIRTKLGTTTVGESINTLTNPSAITYIRINADNTVTTRSATDFRSDIGAQAAGTYLTASNIVATITNGVTTNAPSEDAVFDALALKQDTLVSATNIKTINSNSLLGSGDLAISGGDIVYAPTPADVAINNAADQTIATKDLSGIVAGDQIVMEGEFIILNNSTATRVYVITLDFDNAFDIEITTPALATSATLMHPFMFRAVCNVRSTSLAYAVVSLDMQLAAGIASGTDTTMAATHLSGKGWGESASNLTGTLTCNLKIRSANNTATQTCRLINFIVRKTSPVG
jgi:hypothetical protein